MKSLILSTMLMLFSLNAFAGVPMRLDSGLLEGLTAEALNSSELKQLLAENPQLENFVGTRVTPLDANRMSKVYVYYTVDGNKECHITVNVYSRYRLSPSSVSHSKPEVQNIDEIPDACK